VELRGRLHGAFFGSVALIGAVSKPQNIFLNGSEGQNRQLWGEKKQDRG
jgi:hypothetical protein